MDYACNVRCWVQPSVIEVEPIVEPSAQLSIAKSIRVVMQPNVVPDEPFHKHGNSAKLEGSGAELQNPVRKHFSQDKLIIGFGYKIGAIEPPEQFTWLRHFELHLSLAARPLSLLNFYKAAKLLEIMIPHLADELPDPFHNGRFSVPVGVRNGSKANTPDVCNGWKANIMSEGKSSPRYAHRAERILPLVGL